MSDRKAIVTGASGFVGRQLIAALDAAGYRGTAVSREGDASGLPLHWVAGRRDAVLAHPTQGRNVEAIVHLEVKQHVFRPTPRDLQDFHTVNVAGTQAWLDWCTRAGVRRFVHFSSIKAVRPAATGATDENAGGPLASPYGASKWAAEQRVTEWVRGDPANSAVILRPAVVYGPGGQGNITAMAAAIHEGRFFLVGRNENIKSMVALENLTAATAFLAQRMQPGRVEVYNVVDAESLTVREIDAIIRGELCRAGNSPALPVALARVAGLTGDLAMRGGWRGCPINSSRVNALLEETHFSPQKLIAAGFVHPRAVRDGLKNLARSVAVPRSTPSHG